jgi:hypothetical protein
VDASGTLRIAYVNTFLGNSDIFHMSLAGGKWTFPQNISGTSGASKDPALAADRSGGVYVTWMDFTSGAWRAHTGRFDGAFWINYPVPNATGGSPSIAVLPDGNLFLAWHGRVPTLTDSLGLLNIFGSEQTGGTWDLPVNISDNAAYNPGAESKGVSVVAAADAKAHLAWVDNDNQPRYDFGRGLYWPAPVDLGPRQDSATGLSLQLGANNMLRVTWETSTTPMFTSAPIGAQRWPSASPLPGTEGKTYGASLAVRGEVMAVAWLQDNADAQTIYEARYGLAGPLLKYWMPIVTQ